MDERYWVLVVKGFDKPGVLTAAASVFSNRGVSLKSILGSGISSTTQEDSRLIFRFQASAHKKDMLLRALERLPQVQYINAYADDDPQVRAIAIASVSTLDAIDLTAEAVQTETVSKTANGLIIMLTGSTQGVEQTIEMLRQHNVLLDVVTSAIAV